MAWETKLTESDYSVLRNGLSVTFCDNRNKRAYKLSEDAVRHIRQRIGTMMPDGVWISIAINAGYIPHPYDEYV